MCWIDEEHCTQGIRCLDNYTKAWDEKHGHYKSEPVHNWASHGADALHDRSMWLHTRLHPAA